MLCELLCSTRCQPSFALSFICEGFEVGRKSLGHEIGVKSGCSSEIVCVTEVHELVLDDASPYGVFEGCICPTLATTTRIKIISEDYTYYRASRDI